MPQPSKPQEVESSEHPETTSPGPQLPDELKFQMRPSLPTLWVDRVAFSVRLDRETQGGVAVLLSFFQELPATKEESPAFEIARIAMSFGQARSLVEIMAKQLGAAPTKTTEEAQ